MTQQKLSLRYEIRNRATGKQCGFAYTTGEPADAVRNWCYANFFYQPSLLLAVRAPEAWEAARASVAGAA